MAEQWVNLPKEERFAEDGITTERCGKITLDVTFENDKQLVLYWVKVTAVGDDNATYTPQEEGRNSNFKVTKTVSVSDKKNVLLEESIQLPAAGGNKYKIEAKDFFGNEVASSTEVETRRRLYYQVISMASVPYPNSLSTFEDAFKEEAKKFFIELKEKEDGRNKMRFIKTVHSGNGTKFRDEARKVYGVSRYEPYAVAVVFSNYIAEKKFYHYRDEVDITLPSRLFSWGDKEVTVRLTDTNGDPVYVWHNLEGGDYDDRKGWLAGSVVFRTASGKPITVPKKDVSLTGSKTGAWGGYSELKIKLNAPGLRNVFTEQKGKFDFSVLVVKGFSGGFSYTFMNLITVATKGWWNPNTKKKMLQILNHEMGHKVGMVADGTGLAPDKPTKLYGENRGVNDRGHKGPHCGKGCNWNGATEKWSGVPGCVMFGATGLFDTATKTYSASPDTFCGECAKVVRKLDLDGSNLPGLKNRF